MSQQTPPTTKILLVDDEPSVLLALKLLLEALGYSVTTFTSGKEAIQFLNGPDEIDLFICDLRMPDMNGLQTLVAAKQVRPNLNFILMSGHANKADLEQAKGLGVNGFLAKPFMPDQLKALIAGLNKT